MYQLYFYAPWSSWSLRPWLLLKELAIPFEEKEVARLNDKALQKQQFLQFSPTAKVPVLHHQGNVIWDSLAIIEYIAENYPQVWAEDPAVRAWSRSVCSEMHSGFTQLREICSYEPLERISLAEIPDELVQELERINEIWTQGLTQFQGKFLAGDQFTAVDAFFAPVVGRIETYGLQRFLSPIALDYQQRIQQSANVQLWLNKVKQG